MILNLSELSDEPLHAQISRQIRAKILSEDLESDPLKLMKHVCRFLEIDPDFGFPDLTAPREAVSGDWLDALPGLSRWRRNRHSPRGKAERDRCTLGPEQRAYALRELRDDLARLEDEWGFDVSAWNLES